MGRNYKDLKNKKNPNWNNGHCSNRKSYYNTWQNMKGRCLRKTHPKYHRYGGRGITIFEEWLDINNFYEWSINNGWENGLSLDRIDNDGNYEPSNCRWVTMSENSRKKSTTKIDLIKAQEIRERINEDWQKLSNEYKCSHGNIWFIMNNFTHVEDGECSKRLKERCKKNENSTFKQTPDNKGF